MPTLAHELVVSAGSVSIQASRPRVNNTPIAYEQLQAAPKAVSAWVKTDLDTAGGNLAGGHGYTSGRFDVFWTTGAGGRRYGVTGTITTNALALEGGVGDDFPATADATVVACKCVQWSATIRGSSLDFLAVAAELSGDSTTQSRAHVSFTDSSDTSLLALDLKTNSVTKVKQYDVAGGTSTAMAGSTTAWAYIGVEAAMTIKIVGMQDGDF